MTTVAYAPLTQAEQVFKTLIWDPMIKAGEVWIAGAEATLPILDLPVIQGLEDDVLGIITDAIFSKLVLFIDITTIKLVNAELQSKWSTASESLAIIAQEQGATSDAYKKALAESAADFAAWVHTGP